MFTRFALVFLVLIAFSYGRQLPSFINRCKKDDPKLNQCMKKALIDIKPYLNEGIPEMKIPSADPFRVDNVALKTPGFSAVLRNVSLFNVSNYEPRDLTVDFIKDTLELQLYLPFVRLTGNYSMVGKLLFLQIEGSGHAEANFTEIDGNLKLHGKKQEKNGKTYLKLNEVVNHKLRFGNAKAQLDNLFKNNPELTQRTNEILNENMQDLLAEFTPLLENSVVPVVFSLFQVVFNRYSLEELFLS